jgi:hypothetical protein
MEIAFLTPAAGVVAVAAVVPLMLLIRGERRVRRVRDALGVAPPTRTRRTEVVASVIALPSLLGLAATQPIVDRSTDHVTRTDAEIFFVIDTSRSMVASETASSQTRIQRARAAAIRLRRGLVDVPAGVASMTDRLLPHLFPTPDMEVFDATVERAVGIEQPAPVNWNRTATTLGALSAIATRNFFSPAIANRVVVVLTDAESRPFATQTVGALFRRKPSVDPIFVRIGTSRERIYTLEGDVELAYQPSPAAASGLQALAAATGGQAFDERTLEDVVPAVKRVVGRGRTEVRGDERNKLALAPYAVALAFLPLGLLLWRRNF